MVARWHLDLLAAGLVAGVLLAVSSSWVATRGEGTRVSRILSGRSIAIAGVVGALLGATSPLGQGGPRGWPWFVAAGLMVLLPADRGDRVHPLGRWVLPMTIASLAGAWSAVPDTEPALAVAAALAPMTLVSMITVARPTVGPASTAALIVAIGGSVWVGSAGWGSALAVVFVIGMVASTPIVVGFSGVEPDIDPTARRGHGTGVLTGRAVALLVGVHVMIVLLLPRVVMRRSVPVAVATAVGAVVAMFAVTVLSSVDGTPDRSVRRAG